MLTYARERAERKGFTPNLQAQAMHELDMPRTYRTIYSCGSLASGGPDGRTGRRSHASTIAVYTAAHVELLLETSGFGDIQMLDNWTDVSVTPDTANVTFVARTPS